MDQDLVSQLRIMNSRIKQLREDITTASTVNDMINCISRGYEMNIKFDLSLEAIFVDVYYHMLWLMQAIKLIRQFDTSYKSEFLTNSEFKEVLNIIRSTVGTHDQIIETEAEAISQPSP